MNTIRLVEWYRDNFRKLPWRKTRDPYRIWISEVILQQTRVAQGLDYYLRFTERFPEVTSLARAEEDEVLRLWQGLGYYSRARNLHHAAKQVVLDFGGLFPTDYDALRRLKGVGEYTAAAISSFSTDQPHAVVDGNVYRVLSRLYDIDTPIDTTAGKKTFSELAALQLTEHIESGGSPGEYNQAIMELGALVCTPSNPSCVDCPVGERCLARQRERTAKRPVKKGKTTQTVRYFHYFHVTDPYGNVLLRKRSENDIWQGLYEFPLIETEQLTDFTVLIRRPEWVEILGAGDKFTLKESITMPKHILSHRIIRAVFHRILAEHRLENENYLVVPGDQIGKYALPRLIDLYLEKHR